MDRLYYQTVSIPAGTPVATPVSIAWPMEDNYLKYVDINVPPGPSGLMGFRILWAGQQIIPWGNDSFLVTDNEKIHVDVDSYITVTGLVIQGYNTDIFAHTIYLRGLIQTLTPQQILAAEEATGSIALPASLDVGDTSGINSLVGTSVGGYSDQDIEDMNVGLDESQALPVTTIAAESGSPSLGTPSVATGGNESPNVAPSAGITEKPAKKPAPVRHLVKVKTHVGSN